mgnify:FL=1
MDETWFPTVVNDVVVLPNGTQGQVLRQTPEYVYLNSFGVEIIYPTKDFIKDKVVNLSYGYSVSSEVGLNYNTLQQSIEEVTQLLNDEVSAYIKEKSPEAFKSMKSLTIDLTRLTENGYAVFMVYITMGSFSTDYKGKILRLAAQGSILAAEKHGWNLTGTRTVLVDNISQ